MTASLSAFPSLARSLCCIDAAASLGDDVIASVPRSIPVLVNQQSDSALWIVEHAAPRIHCPPLPGPLWRTTLYQALQHIWRTPAPGNHLPGVSLARLWGTREVVQFSGANRKPVETRPAAGLREEPTAVRNVTPER
ncbi:hypothetical protein SKAU_G00197950 [Synaphobranchus kaupii]|uniref:Uncharacterized protein n=1 Tax=Synaphobranchus kaupii TaxID=118154 RepID=A0A9Q1FEU1_SYNKA|nr:hypothetical protein SKAU_G00197950 [Synaphobranchus kaupii]